MAQIVTRCPLTGHYAFMGIDVEAERFAHLPEIFTRQYCPFCACDHDWRKKDAKLQESRLVMRRGIQQAS
jgi:hypothetical protein